MINMDVRFYSSNLARLIVFDVLLASFASIFDRIMFSSIPLPYISKGKSGRTTGSEDEAFPWPLPTKALILR